HMNEASSLGMWTAPMLPTTEADPRLVAPQALQQDINRFLQGGPILFWDLGGGLTDEQTNLVMAVSRFVRGYCPQRPRGACGWDGLRAYSRNLDLVGAHRWPLLTGLGLPEYRDWLNQRRLLARSGAFFWTWIQTHLPDWYTNLVYEQPATSGFNEPIGPQPEQI